jgi:putative peptide zinc metalloprotease protein
VAETELPPPAPGREIADIPPDGRPPQLADGIDLIGEYADSGFKQAPYIARRADGQVIQLPQLLYMIAEEIDGRASYEQIAGIVTERFQRGVSAENIQFLVDEKLRPLGVVAQPDGSTPELQKADPMLALKFRAALVPETFVNALTTIFKPLFFPAVIVAVLAGLVAVDVWLFFLHGVAQSLRSALYDPVSLLLLLGLVIASAAFHETGHATACAYGGARPGVMGAGIYIVWPAFYTDVTDAYRLGKGGRLRTDLGGVYFNVIFILGVVGAYAVTGFEPLLLFVPIMHLEIIHQFLPFIRLDGYYIVSDLTGVPDMFARIKPTLTSLLPWKETPDKVTELKRWVRVAVTVYVLTVVPLLLFMFTLMVINAPRIFATAWDSFFVQYHKLGHVGGVTTMLAVIQMVVLVLPVLGIVVTFGRVGQRVGVAVWRRTEGRPAPRAALVVASAAAAAGIGYIWWPNGDYRPIQRGEKGTVQGAIEELPAIPTGRPALTKQRATQLHDAPFESSTSGKTGKNNSTTDTGTSTTETQTQTTQTDTTAVTTTSSGATVGASTPTATATTPATTATVGTGTTATVTTP